MVPDGSTVRLITRLTAHGAVVVQSLRVSSSDGDARKKDSGKNHSADTDAVLDYKLFEFR